MNAMVFAAGYGSRLGRLTEACPKALIEVGRRPMLGRVLDNLEAAGIVRTVVNTHHLARQVEAYLADRPRGGMQIMVSDETDRLLDTGGGLAKAVGQLGTATPVMAHNVDILTDLPLVSLLTAHTESGADVTLLAVDRPTSRKLLFAPDGRMTGWINTTTGATRPASADPASAVRLGFCGIQVLGPAALRELVEYAAVRGGDPFSITDFYIDRCTTLDIRAFTPESPIEWFDIGRPETLEAARMSSLSGLVP